MLRVLGTLVCVGIPKLDFNIPITPFAAIVKGVCHSWVPIPPLTGECLGLNVVGTTCIAKDEEDVQALLQMAVKKDIRPQIEVFDLADVNLIKTRLEEFHIKGRAVLRIPP